MDTHSERVTLFATALNNLGVAAIVAGIVAPLVRGEINEAASLVIWLVIGLDLIGLAQVWLGRLRQ